MSYDFIRELKKLDGAVSYDGDCSVQVVFHLSNGKTLRIGMTDEDENIWCDQYTGLNNDLKKYFENLHSQKEQHVKC